MVVYTPHVCSRVQHLCSSPASPNVVVFGSGMSFTFCFFYRFVSGYSSIVSVRHFIIT